MFTANYLFKYRLNNLRNVSKGYCILKSSNQLDFIDNLKISFTNTLIDSRINKTNFIKIDSSTVPLETCVRQFVLQRFIGVDFNKEVLATIANKKKKFAYPLPKEWQKILQLNGINTNKLTCSLLWNLQILKFWLIASYELIYQIVVSFIFIISNSSKRVVNFIHFDSLGVENIPTKNGSYDYGIFSWYYKKYDTKNIEYFTHTVPLKNELILNNKIKTKFLRRPFYPILTFGNLLIFIFNSILRLLISLFLVFKGEWWNALLLRDSMFSKIVALNQNIGIAKRYIFNNSKWIYRPIWTYTAEKYKSEIFFYFYSTNIERFKTMSKITPIVNSWNLMSWSNYIVWDNFQADFIKNIAKFPYKIEVAGPVYFVFADEIGVEIEKNTIAVFDIQPVKSTFYESLAISQEYYVPEIANAFLRDVFECLTTLNHPIAFKRKRNIGKTAHYKYVAEINRISKDYDFLNIEPSIPAEFIIEKAKAVISMPFTSTALVGKHLGKPSIFYDPSGLVLKDDPAAHGIMVINNKKDLKDWLSTI